MYDYLKKLITPDMVFFGVPSGQNRLMNLAKPELGGQCFGTHPNVPVIGECVGPNRIVDGGVNLWDDATHPTCWDANISGSTVNREATEKIEGDFSCRFDVDALNSNLNIEKDVDTGWINLTPGKKYKLVIWYKMSAAGKTVRFDIGNSGANVRIQEDGTWYVGFTEITIPNSTVWTPYELEFYAHPDYSEYLIRIQRKDAASSSIYLDNISIREVGSSLINPSVGWVFGGDDYINCGTDKSLDITDEVTVVTWVMRQGAQTGFPVLAAKGNAYGLIMKAADNKPYFSINCSGGNNYRYFVDALPNETFVLLGGTYDSSSSRINLYRNGVYEAGQTHAHGGNISTSINPLALGGGITANFLKGCAVFSLVANKVWSAAQHRNFYLQTKGMFAPRE